MTAMTSSGQPVTKRAITRVERRFTDAGGRLRTLAIVVHEHGWDAELDGEPLYLGAFRDICALLAVTQ